MSDNCENCDVPADACNRDKRTAEELAAGCGGLEKPTATTRLKSALQHGTACKLTGNLEEMMAASKEVIDAMQGLIDAWRGQLAERRKVANASGQPRLAQEKP